MKHASSGAMDAVLLLVAIIPSLATLGFVMLVCNHENNRGSQAGRLKESRRADLQTGNSIELDNSLSPEVALPYPNRPPLRTDLLDRVRAGCNDCRACAEFSCSKACVRFFLYKSSKSKIAVSFAKFSASILAESSELPQQHRC